jgi:Phage integrase, N-terminal SAM-like domain
MWSWPCSSSSADPPDRPATEVSRYTTKTEASEALGEVLECERAGARLDDTETVARYLTSWLDTKSRDLRPNTVLRCRDYISQVLIPAIGAVRLERLTHEHVRQFIGQPTRRRTLARCITTLSGALDDAVKQRRLPHSPARYAGLPRVHRTVTSSRGAPAKSKGSCATATASTTHWPTCSN